MFTNPLDSPLFWPFAYAICGFLGIAVLYMLFVERKQLTKVHKSSLFPRIVSSAIIAPLAVLSILSGTVPLTLMTCALVVIATLEYASVTKLPRAITAIAVPAGVVMVLAAAFAPLLLVGCLVAYTLAIGTASVLRFKQEAGQPASPVVLQQAAFGILAAAYAPLLGSHIIFISRIDGGIGILIALMAGVAMSDTMAFVVGKFVGGPKLAPHVSPNKTISGAFGNVIGAYGGFLALQFACPPLPMVVLIGLPLVIAAGTIFGDLFESLIKRSFGVKDAGTWLPGFGGLLDRVDSMLFVLPASYHFLLLTV